MKKVVFFIRWVNHDGNVLISQHYIPSDLRNFFMSRLIYARNYSHDWAVVRSIISFFLDTFIKHPDYFPDSSMCGKFYLRVVSYRKAGWLMSGFSILKSYLL